MSYSFDSRVRFSEIGEDRKLTLNAVLNYFQDASTFHSEDAGLGMNYLAQKKRAWLLSSWQIIIRRYPSLGEKIQTNTWPYEFKKFFGGRNFTMTDAKGEIVAYANSLWVFVDTNTGHPTALGEDIIKGYPLEEKMDMEYASRKVSIPSVAVEGEPFPVRTYHLDTNHHVNNGQYIQMAKEFIPLDFSVRQMRAEYKKQALLGQMILPKISHENDKYTIALCDKNEYPYVIVEFQ